MSIFGLPLILFTMEEKDELSDIEYLAKKEFDNKRFDVNGTLSLANTTVETTIITKTAEIGKDMYMASASINGYVAAINGTNVLNIRLYVNNVVVDTFVFRADNTGDEFEYDFKNAVDKVTTGQIIKITMQHSNAVTSNQSVTNAKLVLWQEDTGVDPTT